MNKEKTDISLSFDLGIASVGWAIIETNTNNVLNLGVRLFSERQKANERRGFRSIRRMLRRKKYKNDRFINLILKNKDIFHMNSVDEIYNSFQKLSNKWNNILELKSIALKQKINANELVWILHDYLKNRGFFYLAKDDDNPVPEYKGLKFPTQHLLKFFEKNKFSKSISSIHKDNGGAIFSNKQWEEEINHLFDIQKIDEEFRNDFLKLFTYIRNFSLGPGSIHSATPYGIYHLNNEGKIEKKFNNIWEKTIGKCSLFDSERVISLSYPSYEFFNLLNDLANIRSNLKIEENANDYWKLSSNNKIDLLEKLLKDLSNKTKKTITNITIAKIEKILKEEANSKGIELPNQNLIKKFNSTNKLTNLKTFYELLSVVSKFKNEDHWINMNNIWNYLPIFDSICAIFEEQKRDDELILDLKNQNISKKLFIDEKFENEFLQEIIKLRNIDFKKRGSLSLKAINLYLSKMKDEKFEHNSEYIKWNDSEIQTILKEKDLNNNSNYNSNAKYLDPFIFENDILSPAAKQTFEQSIKVLNRIIKLYSKNYNIKSIVIEMPKTKNDKETIDKINKENIAKTWDEIMKKLSSSAKDALSKLDKRPKSLIEKIKLYLEQDGIDLYSLQKIDINDLINHPQKYEIDHIIPYSLSYDNSNANKTLTTKSNNAAKGQKTAYQYLSSVLNLDMNEYKEEWKKILIYRNNSAKSSKVDKDSMYKKYELLTLEDNFDLSTQIGFLNRNLNDTRYATRLFVNRLKKHFSKDVSIIGIKGHVTSYFRNKVGIKKDRDFNYHHAIDALIIGIIANKNKYLANILDISDNVWEIVSDHQKKNRITGEIIELRNRLDIKKNIMAKELAHEIKEKVDEIKDNQYKGIKYSRKIKKITNIQLYDNKLYGLKETDKLNKGYKIIKLNLLENENSDLEKYFNKPIETNKYEVLMAISHPKEFKKLKEIFDKGQPYKFPKENAFKKYMDSLNEEFPEIISKELIENAKATKRVVYLDLKNKQWKYFKNLRIVEKKDIALDFKYVSKHDGGKSFKDKNSQLCSLVYKNKKNAYRSIPINFLLLNFGNKQNDLLNEEIYNKENLNKYKKVLSLDTSSKPLFVLKKGTILKKKNFIDGGFDNLYYISSISKKTGSDTKYVLKNLMINSSDKKQENSWLTNTLLKEFDIVHFDELGNEFKKEIFN